VFSAPATPSNPKQPQATPSNPKLGAGPGRGRAGAGPGRAGRAGPGSGQIILTNLFGLQLFYLPPYPPPPLPQACAKAPNIEDIWGQWLKPRQGTPKG